MPDLPDILQLDNNLIWVLIGVCVIMVFTLEAVQTAVEGAWPHQRRPSTMLPRERNAHAIWGVVAIALIVGGLLLICNLGIVIWQEIDHTETQVIASFLLGVSWLMFIGTSIDRFGIRSYITSIGIAAPIAVLAMLVAADVLLSISLIDIWPSLDEIRDALPVITIVAR